MRIDVIVLENIASTPTAKGGQMDTWELGIRESVRQTLADCTAATDRFDLRGLAACFAPDGVLEFTGGAHPLTGPGEIEAGLGAAMSKDPDPARPAPTHVRHHVSSIRFGSVAIDRV
jgi:SnoaL-like domain